MKKYLMAGMTLALVAGPALSLSTMAQAEPGGMRYSIVKTADGSCAVSISQRTDVLGRFDSRSAADRALAVLKSGSEC